MTTTFFIYSAVITCLISLRVQALGFWFVLWSKVVVSYRQRTCYLHGAPKHDSSGRLHVRGTQEEETRPKTVKNHFYRSFLMLYYYDQLSQGHCPTVYYYCICFFGTYDLLSVMDALKFKP